jgi:hypothetical protein
MLAGSTTHSLTQSIHIHPLVYVAKHERHRTAVDAPPGSALVALCVSVFSVVALSRALGRW